MSTPKRRKPAGTPEENRRRTHGESNATPPSRAPAPDRSPVPAESPPEPAAAAEAPRPPSSPAVKGRATVLKGRAGALNLKANPADQPDNAPQGTPVLKGQGDTLTLKTNPADQPDNAPQGTPMLKGQGDTLTLKANPADQPDNAPQGTPVLKGQGNTLTLKANPADQPDNAPQGTPVLKGQGDTLTLKANPADQPDNAPQGTPVLKGQGDSLTLKANPAEPPDNAPQGAPMLKGQGDSLTLKANPAEPPDNAPQGAPMLKGQGDSLTLKANPAEPPDNAPQGAPMLKGQGDSLPLKAQPHMPATAPALLPASSSGTLGELIHRLTEAGIPPEGFFAALGPLDLTDAAASLQYLRFVDLSSPGALERLLFHLDLLRNEPPVNYAKWTKLLQDVRHASQLSSSSADFVRREDIAERLHALLLSRIGLRGAAPLDTREHVVAYFRSVFRFLESLPRLMAEDPNLAVVLRAIQRDGSLQAYYAREPAARRAVQRLIEAGYDADYLVFGRQDILTLGPSKTSGPDGWVSRLVAVAKSLIGGKDVGAEVDLGLPRGKLYQEIKDDYAAVKDRRDTDAGLRVVEALLGAVEGRPAALLQSGNVAAESRATQIVQELRYLRRVLTHDGQAPEPQRLRAVRSKQLVPEILFDNTRFACCLFKPSGLFHGEISRLLLDPATPMIELWLDPYPEFLGLVTLYPGKNARGERTILMDTVDYDDRLLDLRGNNGTLRFMLDAMVVDAHLAGAEKLLVFSAPYGKPINFANYVKALAPRCKSITYHAAYFFVSVDPEDGALAASRAGRHHYTVALGYDRPMRGVIDYGYNLVGPGRVEKHLGGGRGVFEINVRAFIEEHELGGRIPQKEPGVAREADAAVHRRPAHHAEEMARRDREAFARGLAAVRAVAPELTLERRAPSDELLPELLAVEHAAFPQNLAYREEHLRLRFAEQNAELWLLRKKGALVGFSLVYNSPFRPPSELYLDDIAILPEYQDKGLGSAIVKAIGGVAAVRGFGSIDVLVQPGSESKRLVQFYQRNGFVSRGDFRGIGLVFEKALGIAGPDNREAVDALLQEATRLLSAKLTRPRITFHTSLDPQLLRIVQGLEAAFPEGLRYTSSQFRQKMTCRDAYILVVWEQSEPIAFGIAFHDPQLPDHAILQDVMSVRPDFQKHGIGKIIKMVMLGLPTLAGYTAAVFFCEPKNSDGVDLVEFYSRFVGDVIDSTSGRTRMVAPLTGPSMDCFKRYRGPGK